MANVFIFHGAYGNPSEHWIPSVQSHLEREGHTVYAPHFPTPDGQELTAWLKVLDLFTEHLTPGSIFVGHSIGAAFALRALEVRDIRVKGTILVAGFVSRLHHPKFDPLNHTFLEPRWDWERIKERAGRILAFASDDDPYVPLAKTDELREKLECDIVKIQLGGHFNTKSGFTTFPKLLEAVDDMAQGR